MPVTYILPIPALCVSNCRSHAERLIAAIDTRTDIIVDILPAVHVILQRLDLSVEAATPNAAANCKQQMLQLQDLLDPVHMLPLPYKLRMVWIDDRFGSNVSGSTMNEYIRLAEHMWRIGLRMCDSERQLKRKIEEIAGHYFQSDTLRDGFITLRAMLYALEQLNDAWRQKLQPLLEDIDCIKYIVDVLDAVNRTPFGIGDYCTDFVPRFQEWE